jgi:hypothetical protein
MASTKPHQKKSKARQKKSKARQKKSKARQKKSKARQKKTTVLRKKTKSSSKRGRTRASKRARPARRRASVPEASTYELQQSDVEDSNDAGDVSIPVDRDMPERGLSVEPEALGERYIRDATNPDGTLAETDPVDQANEEPSAGDVNLLSNTIRDGSLFDQPTDQGTRTPSVRADEKEQEEDTESREEAIRETREVLSHGRSRADKPFSRGND